ncbi:hypothetical protein BO99DRAFT_249778 [Aspergillus violaceofuscus CBS 115571]|uniref:Uncharacterized protein n=1 Tax=Aspergillus violaceofuscus (strain CBS 115571) TaxID=1450538 RepID=A0A2V5H1H5_ASPV1|nr:hypothetical protein BO99DRAFT_249778 [Aspergillus violaceofuscus CBS 115571]
MVHASIRGYCMSVVWVYGLIMWSSAGQRAPCRYVVMRSASFEGSVYPSFRQGWGGRNGWNQSETRLSNGRGERQVDPWTPCLFRVV